MIMGFRDRIEAHLYSGLPVKISHRGNVERYFPIGLKAISIPHLELEPGQVLDLSTYAEEWDDPYAGHLAVVANIGSCVLRDGARIQVQGNLLSMVIQDLKVVGSPKGDERPGPDFYHIGILPSSGPCRQRNGLERNDGSELDVHTGRATQSAQKNRLAEITIRQIARDSDEIVVFTYGERPHDDRSAEADGSPTIGSNVFIDCPPRQEAKIRVTTNDGASPSTDSKTPKGCLIANAISGLNPHIASNTGHRENVAPPSFKTAVYVNEALRDGRHQSAP